MFPVELLREAIPAGDIHTEEERRLLYVAMTRAQEHLAAHDARGPGRGEGPVALPRPSCATGQATSWSRSSGRRGSGGAGATEGADAGADADAAPTTGPGARTARGRETRRPWRPCPGSCRRRRRASGGSPCASAPGSCSSSSRASTPDDPEADAARERLVAELAVARPARRSGQADEARARRARPADAARRLARQRRRGQPARGRAAARPLQLLAVRHLRALPAAVRLQPRLSASRRASGAGRWPSAHRARGLRGVHQGATGAARPRGAAADRDDLERLFRGRVEDRRASGTRSRRRTTSGGSGRMLDAFWAGELGARGGGRRPRSSPSS